MPSGSGRRKGPMVDLLSAISSGRNAPPTSNDNAPQKPRDLHIGSVMSSPLTNVESVESVPKLLQHVTTRVNEMC